MRSKIALAVFVASIVGISSHVFARGPGGMGGGGMGGGGSHGPANQSMPSQATSNSNAPWTGTQKKGLDRAQERMSEQGLQNEKATQYQDRRDPKPQSGRPSR